MKIQLIRFAALLLWCVALFPFERWWVKRLAEPLEVSQVAAVALGLLLAGSWWKSGRRTLPPPVWKLYLAAAGIVAFGLLQLYLPITLAALPAVLTVLPLVLPEDSPHGQFPLALAALAFLTLPSAMILDLFLGVPLRALAVAGAAEALRLIGFELVQRGLELSVNGQAIWVDAPCAGVKMLGTMIWLTCIFAYLFQLNTRRTIVLGGLSLFLVLTCNCARVALLTASEALGHHFTPSIHSAIGLLALLPGIFTLAFAAYYLEKHQAHLCKPPNYPSPPNGDRPHASDGDSPPSNGDSPHTHTNSSFFIPHSSFDFGDRPHGQWGQTPCLPLSALVLATALCLGTSLTRGTDPTASGDRPHDSANSSFFIPHSSFDFGGQTPEEVPLTAQELAFSKEFPGEIKRFKAGNEIIICRWTQRATHRAHSANVCLAASGWKLTPLPLTRRSDGDWSTFRAEREGKILVVREQVRASDGTTFPDIPSWFIQALLGKTQGPWLITTIASPETLEPST